MSPRTLRRRAAFIAAAAGAAVAAPAAVGAFVLDGTVANTPGNLQPAGEPAIVLGSLKGTGTARVPWIVQTQPAPGGGADQVFSETFSGGAFTQQGDALNFNPAAPASHPDIDFTGNGDRVPWGVWEEPAAGVGQIFASRFVPAATGQGGAWEINGALRGSPVVPSLQRGPTLNVDPDRAASEPRVAGGSLQPGGEGVPWVTWVEEVGGAGTQIFVSRGAKDATPGPAQRGPFTWHLQGTDRGPAGIGPTLNVEIAAGRDGVHPDIAFTGPSNTVPWVVWYEEPAAGAPAAAPANEKVFAAKFVPDPALGDRGGRWIPEGRDAGCQFSAGSESATSCSLNVDPDANAENPNVAAGSLTPGGVTVPWVAFREEQGGVGRIRLTRLVGGSTFVPFAGPNPDGSLNADPAAEADEPDLHFEANVLVVTWKERSGAATHTFTRRFTPGPGGQGGTWSAATDLTVDPTRQSGNPAVGSFGGSPFVIWAEGAPRGGGDVFGATLLKHDQAQVQASTADPSGITATGTRLNGAVAGSPGVYAVSFDVGPTTAYGDTLAAGDTVLNAGEATRAVSATLTGLRPDSVIHYRTRVSTALGSVVGPDRALTTAGSGAPGAVGVPPVPAAVATRPARGTVRVRFRLARRWKVTITAHARGRRGPVVGRLVRRFPRGVSTAVVRVARRGRLVITITPRAGRTVVRTVTLR